jgi:hypothetical protein
MYIEWHYVKTRNPGIENIYWTVNKENAQPVFGNMRKIPVYFLGNSGFMFI